MGLGDWWTAGARVESSFDLKTLIAVEVAVFAVLEGFRVKAYEKTGEVGGAAGGRASLRGVWDSRGLPSRNSWQAGSLQEHGAAATAQRAAGLRPPALPRPARLLTPPLLRPRHLARRPAWAPLRPLTLWACAATRPA